MTIETIRRICLAFPAATEDVKWGHDLCFCIARKMFAVIDLNPPHALSFKCSPDDFAELVQRPGIRPAPYMARAMWVQECELGGELTRVELERLLRGAYDAVAARLPAARRPRSPGASGTAKSARSRSQRTR